MMITVGWPGATADQMAEQVIKPIETVLTENIPDIDYVKSKARPGQATLNVTLISTVKGSAVPDIWYTVRKTVTDHRADLPDDVVGPAFNDEFGTTYGNIYAVTGPGFAYPPQALRRNAARPHPGAARRRQDRSDRCAGRGRLRDLRQCAAGDAGHFFAGDRRRAGRHQRRLRLGHRRCWRRTRAPASGRRLRLARGDCGDADLRQRQRRAPRRHRQVERTTKDPATFRMRFGGEDAVGVGISLRDDGNVARLGRT
jgi:multidrug efflux pump